MTPCEKMPDRSTLRKETHSLTHSFMGMQSILVKGVPSGGFQLWWQEQTRLQLCWWWGLAALLRKHLDG